MFCLQSSKAIIKVIVAYFMLFLTGCQNSQTKDNRLFKRLVSDETGLTFSNTITGNDSVNLIVNEYAYMGGGVGIGDFNNDGLQDVFFSGNQVSCRLFLNQGKHTFKDITSSSGVNTSQWCTGVSVEDINNDGWQDIYVCVSGAAKGGQRKNLLYINNHDNTFTEVAEAYGLADTSYSVQAVFFDYDKDGDLDLYLLNNQIGSTSPNNIVPKDTSGLSARQDRLYRNDGKKENSDHPFFTDASLEAGIKEDGYGLGVVVTDVNNDNWPDIFVANDYLSDDILWLNRKDGTFENIAGQSLNHSSYSSMGVDAADINNDGLPDIATLDMMPEDNERQKMMYSFLTYERYELERKAGYQPAFMRNMLQLNRGDIKIRNSQYPRFSEIGQLAGISQTDWSWSVLMADFDNDGWKDIHITNGLGRDLINADFVTYRANTLIREASYLQQRVQHLRQQLDELGEVHLRNYFFRNTNGYEFTDVSQKEGIEDLSISNGAAYADFDNDGDLDLVVNNINDEAFYYENVSERNKLNHHLQLSFNGTKYNTGGIGTKVYLYNKEKILYAEQNLVRGYLSSVDSRMHFGLGSTAFVDSLVVIWPDDKMQVVRSIRTDTLLQLNHANADGIWQCSAAGDTGLFYDITKESGVSFVHKESFFNDYSFQRLLPQKYSQTGPSISIGDVNGDGLNDFYVGGAYNQSGKVYIQNVNGQFAGHDLTTGKKYFEDSGSAFFDADGDGDQDLLVASGSIEFDEGSPYYAPRLYLNDGKGNFSSDPKAFDHGVRTSASCVSVCDFDNDGDVDVFIGGRVSLQFPNAPRSYLLKNESGRFSDVTSSLCEDLISPGMITGAVWTDINNDNRMDLILAGEWMPIRFFLNEKDGFRECTATTGLLKNHGLWRCLVAADMDKDGDEDLIAGNLGMNNKFKATEQYPMKLFYSDRDLNGSLDPLLCYYIPTKSGKRALLPAINLAQFAEQVPSVRKKFIYNSSYSKAGIKDILDNEKAENVLESVELKSCWFENKGRGKYEKHYLPIEAQFAPLNSVVCSDFNNDAVPDILVAGNEYQADVMSGRYDALFSQLLAGVRSKEFKSLDYKQSGIATAGDIRCLKTIVDAHNKKLILFAQNNGAVSVFRAR